MASSEQRKTLRQSLRQQRRALSPTEQALAAESLCQQALRSPHFQRAQHIAFYLPADGEIDPTPLLRAAIEQEKCCYLPVLRPGQQLRFVQWRPDQPLTANRYGINEPKTQGNALSAAKLQLIFMPLVGFDRRGNRLGMGGGYYDRSLAQQGARAYRPKLIGLAHQLQEVAGLESEAWDIPMDAVLTDKEWIRTKG